MNMIIEADGTAGFGESKWIGQQLNLGSDVRAVVALPTPRCVMTTLEQEGLPADLEVIRTLVRHNREQVAELGKFPCAGVYAVATAYGTIKKGASVVPFTE